MTQRSRNWCFTDFELLDFPKIYKAYDDIIRYVGWGLETCPKTGKKHYQGWIQFENPKRMSRVKSIIDSKKIHVERCKGSALQNNDYCEKDGMFESLGTFVTQGQRTDLEIIKKKIKDNVSMLSIADDHFETYLRCHKGLTKYKEMNLKETTKKFRKVEVILLSGPTGTNKTRTAMEEATYKIQGSELQWFDGYEGEKCICIDEYANDVKITKLLALLDGYQLRLPIKGGFTYANWNKVYITTNLERLHVNAIQRHRDALSRRVTKHIVCVTKCTGNTKSVHLKSETLCVSQPPSGVGWWLRPYKEPIYES